MENLTLVIKYGYFPGIRNNQMYFKNKALDKWNYFKLLRFLTK